MAEANKICAICQISILDDDTVKRCEGCNAEFHEECWNENGGCATYGCQYVPQTVKDDEEQEQTYWGAEIKKCPMCGETIPANVLQCPYCREEFDGIEPTSRDHLRNRLLGRISSRTPGSGTAILIFILGLIGCVAPFNLILGGIWYKKNRAKLKESSPTHNLLAIVGLSVSAVYTIFIILIIIFRS